MEDRSVRTLGILDPALLLWRKKYLILFFVLVGAGLGAVSAWRSPPLYRYLCGIRVGKVVYRDGGSIRVMPLQDPQDIVASLNQAYIPAAIQTYSAAHTGAPRHYAVTATTARGSRMVTLSATGQKRDGKALVAIMQSASRKVTENADELAAPLRKQYQAQAQLARIRLRELQIPGVFKAQILKAQASIQFAETKLANLRGQEQILAQRLGRHKADVKLVDEEIRQLSRSVHDQGEAREQAFRRPAAPAQAMTLMLLDSAWEHDAARLSDLKRKRDVGLPVERARLVADVAANRRAQADEDARITLLHTRLASLRAQHDSRVDQQEQKVALMDAKARQIRPTELVQAPTRSAYPVGPSRRGRVVLAAVAGLILGVLVAFMLEAISEHRTRGA